MVLVRTNQFFRGVGGGNYSDQESTGELKLGYFTFNMRAVANSNLSPSLPAFKRESKISMKCQKRVQHSSRLLKDYVRNYSLNYSEQVCTYS